MQQFLMWKVDFFFILSRAPGVIILSLVAVVYLQVSTYFYKNMDTYNTNLKPCQATDRWALNFNSPFQNIVDECCEVHQKCP